MCLFCNFWHPGTLTLSPERQSARMSKITNDGLTQNASSAPKWQQWASKGYRPVVPPTTSKWKMTALLPISCHCNTSRLYAPCMSIEEKRRRCRCYIDVIYAIQSCRGGRQRDRTDTATHNDARGNRAGDSVCWSRDQRNYKVSASHSLLYRL